MWPRKNMSLPKGYPIACIHEWPRRGLLGNSVSNIQGPQKLEVDLLGTPVLELFVLFCFKGLRSCDLGQ
jgi:hypothetical protein